MTNDDRQLDELFRDYRAACPDVEPGKNFMPMLWQKIDGRRTFAFAFQRLARMVMTASAALCLFLVGLNLIPKQPADHLIAPTYADALAAEQTAEKTYYTESIRPIPITDQIYDEYSPER